MLLGHRVVNYFFTLLADDNVLENDPLDSLKRLNKMIDATWSFKAQIF